ncbi:hypothetical protein PO878_12220 [Iamia majanohamensis]|uniref:Uncharacterized protein n=1 Tax=Iamia majanohamensis TaxID=467976 RepID=A0AAE9Y3P3_9ACTN|nr:hypothetical protein [Iamia majanohamensis]WCO65265.1 hypothetical protein PO878_12220 [Iamia majanohamensis]
MGAGAVALLAVAAGVVVLGGDDPGAPAAAPTTTFPATWDPEVAPIAEWVEDERDLAFDHPVEVRMLSEEDWLAQADESAALEEEADVEEAEEVVGLLRALGLVSGEVDLEAAGADLAGDGTLAYYDPEAQEVVVRGTELTPAVQVTLAHELTHTLQDQHFDLSRVADPSFDEAEVLRALAEGDAERIEDAYVEARLTPEEQRAYEEESSAGADEAGAVLEETVPPVLRTLSAAPYVLGEAFVDQLLTTELVEAIDGVLADPPTEGELLFPSTRDTTAADVASVSVSAPDGAEVIDEDTFGPLGWYLLLGSQGDPAQALEVVRGWGGDHMVTYRQDDRVCAVVAAVGDSPADTEALGAAARRWAGAMPGGGATVEDGDGQVRLTSCDPGAAATGTGDAGEDLLGYPLVRVELETGLRQDGATATQADCAAGGLLSALPLDVLTSPDGAADPAVQARITEIILACR